MCDVAAQGVSGAIKAVARPTFNCAAGALLKRCTAKSTLLPPTDVQCFAPGTVVKIKSAARSSDLEAYKVLEPVFDLEKAAGTGADDRDDDDGGGGGNGDGGATRADLFDALNEIKPNTAIHAMVQPGSCSARSITLPELAHVVTRHAGVMRQLLHGENILGPLGLKPYTFNGDA